MPFNRKAMAALAVAGALAGLIAGEACLSLGAYAVDTVDAITTAIIAPGSRSTRVTVVAEGVTGVSLSNAIIPGGAGSANKLIGNFSGTTVPAGTPITWTITGGQFASRFVLTAGGALSIGPADLEPNRYVLTVLATPTLTP